MANWQSQQSSSTYLVTRPMTVYYAADNVCHPGPGCGETGNHIQNIECLVVLAEFGDCRRDDRMFERYLN